MQSCLNLRVFEARCSVHAPAFRWHRSQARRMAAVNAAAAGASERRYSTSSASATASSSSSSSTSDCLCSWLPSCWLERDRSTASDSRLAVLQLESNAHEHLTK